MASSPYAPKRVAGRTLSAGRERSHRPHHCAQPPTGHEAIDALPRMMDQPADVERALRFAERVAAVCARVLGELVGSVILPGRS